MKLIFLPELADIAERYGRDDFVDLIWKAREKEQDATCAERRARYGLPPREAGPIPAVTCGAPKLSATVTPMKARAR